MYLSKAAFVPGPNPPSTTKSPPQFPEQSSSEADGSKGAQSYSSGTLSLSSSESSSS